jgi:adenine-specific DNA-methyltransferase
MVARRPTRADRTNKVIPVEDYEHSDAKRTNNPPAGLAHLDREATPIKSLSYDSHLDPQLVWAGKVERSDVEVPAPSIHVHEELSAEKIIGSVRRQRTQQSLFDVTRLELDEAVDFYSHDLDWSNRMILGDSLTVLASLLDRERLRGQAQCVFIDPPYGVKYNSNFQPTIGSRSVTDGKDDSLTREPEMIQAYRDTWELDVHSYLSYLRDRLTMSRELLGDSGSVFVQISDDNLHLVRVLMDEVFGSAQFVAQIVFTKTTGLKTSKSLPSRVDYLLWYAKDRESHVTYPLFEHQDPLESGYNNVELADGHRRSLTKEERQGLAPIPEGGRLYMTGDITAMGPGSYYEVELEGRTFKPATGYWRMQKESLLNLYEQGRIVLQENSLRFVRYFDDFPYRDLTNLWTGFSGARDKRYVVQTTEGVIERCLLLATQPGDLVIDPTCGSGTTALVSERLGRRWVTIDTSRVALAIARERLLTAVYPYFKLRDELRGVDGGFEFETAERVRPSGLAGGGEPEDVTFYDRPVEDRRKVRVSGPFTSEALSRYAVNPLDVDPSDPVPTAHTAGHVEVLLDALRTQGIPRPGAKPLKIESLGELAVAGPLQAEGVVELSKRRTRFAVSLGPQFGAITMAQVSDALQEAIGFGLVVFAGFAVSADAQDKLGGGKIGGTDVALLLANPDLLVGDLLKNTKASQTFRLYASPDVKIEESTDGFRVTVAGVDSYDAATGDVTSYGTSGIQAWFLDDDYDGTVFRVSQAFFPVTDAWDKLSRALRGTVDAELVEQLHSWTSLPFNAGEHVRIAVRVVANDGNAAEVLMDLPETKK